MEIDLNNEIVSELQKNGNVECEKGLSSSSSSNSSIYRELWHACAGPLVSLPRKGNVVVYFPQGHLEQIALGLSYLIRPVDDLPNYGLLLQPQFFCRVANIQLLANKENDEVYTQLSLLPIPMPELGRINMGSKEVEEGIGGEEEDGKESLPKSRPHMFCKTLTPSDTSTHGGFSVPRRAAEDCFPPLDYKVQRPSQELVAKDLHGVEWRFRHIYRGQPRRHLLTTGWSLFVSQKNLVSGDAVLFMRGEDGELRLGIRRALRPKSSLPESVMNSDPDALSAVANAVSTNTMFHVFCDPRASQPEFIVPYQKYIKSISNPITTGTRFKMRSDMDDSPERRCSGVVIGTRDLDPYRWRGSKWKCLMVRWDEQIVGNNHDRVSLWEIDPSSSLPQLNIQSSPRFKKLRTGFLASPRLLDFEESVGSSKVLQGQEKMCNVSPPHGCDIVRNMPADELRRVGQCDFSPTGVGTNVGEFATNSKSDRFEKVLQGQEICELKYFTEKANFSPGVWLKTSLASSYFNLYGPKPDFYPLASKGVRNMYFPYNEGSNPDQSKIILPPSNNSISENASFDEQYYLRGKTSVNLLTANHEDAKDGSANCKLFGFHMERDSSAPNIDVSCKRSCTKVHKQGSLVGRAIDLSKLKSYEDLINELENLFGMEGLLQDPGKGWSILYTDYENDVMVVGDDPWQEFCNVVSKIQIQTREEVEKMKLGMVTDDNNSCLE